MFAFGLASNTSGGRNLCDLEIMQFLSMVQVHHKIPLQLKIWRQQNYQLLPLSNQSFKLDFINIKHNLCSKNETFYLNNLIWIYFSTMLAIMFRHHQQNNLISSKIFKIL